MVVFRLLGSCGLNCQCKRAVPAVVACTVTWPTRKAPLPAVGLSVAEAKANDPAGTFSPLRVQPPGPLQIAFCNDRSNTPVSGVTRAGPVVPVALPSCTTLAGKLR